MEISATTQTGNSSGVAITGILNPVNTAVPDTESISSPVAKTVTDAANTSSQNLIIARRVMTQQLTIALQLSSTNTPYQSSSGDSTQSQQAASQYLTQQALQKFGQQHHGEHEHAGRFTPTVNNVLIQVDQGFSNTTTVLTNMGLMQGQAADEVSQTRDEVVQAVQDQTAQQTPVSSSSNSPENIKSMTLDSVTAQRTLTTSMQLTTREGDVVTIDFSRSQSLTADRFSSGGNDLLQVNSDREMQFEITLQGDLNARESRSIRKALAQVTEIARKMFSGKVEAAMEKLNEFHINNRQLASMALNMTSSQSMEATSAYAEISGLGSEHPSEQAAQEVTSANAPVQTSPANNTIDNASSQTTPITANAPEDTPSTVPLPNEESAAVVISKVVQESASIVTEVVDNSYLENPFQQIRQMFSAISSMFHADNQSLSASHHRHNIMQLFEGITDNVERRHHHEHRHGHHDSHRLRGHED